MPPLTKQLIDRFPYPYRIVSPDRAVAEWRAAQKEPGVSAIILGGAGSFSDLASSIDPGSALGAKAKIPHAERVGKILEKAAKITFPGVIQSENQQLAEKLIASGMLLPPKFQEQLNQTSARPIREELEEAAKELVASWPWRRPRLAQMPNVLDDDEGDSADGAYLGLFPTEDWTEIPAYLSYGGWNACHAPEVHIAAWRHWRDHYGARLFALTNDTLELHAERRPQTREEALLLALEQSLYCRDLILQIYRNPYSLAAALMESEGWGFWWD